MDLFGDQPGEQQIDQDGRDVSRHLSPRGSTVRDSERRDQQGRRAVKRPIEKPPRKENAKPAIVTSKRVVSACRYRRPNMMTPTLASP